MPGATLSVSVPPPAIVPAGCPVNVNCVGSDGGFVAFLTTSVARFVFVNVQVIVSPAASWNVAVRCATSPRAVGVVAGEAR